MSIRAQTQPRPGPEPPTPAASEARDAGTAARGSGTPGRGSGTAGRGSATAGRGGRPAALAAARVDRAGALLGALGLGSSLFVLWRLIETWHVTPGASAHRFSILGQTLSYPTANLAAVVVVALA